MDEFFPYYNRKKLVFGKILVNKYDKLQGKYFLKAFEKSLKKLKKMLAICRSFVYTKKAVT